MQTNPILTNAHTHLELGWLADYCPDTSGADFIPWIRGLIEIRAAMGDKLHSAQIKAIETGIQTLIDCGTTHVGDISLSGYSIEPLLDSGLGGVVYVEVLNPFPDQADETLKNVRAMVERWRPHERNGMRVGVTIHTLYTVHPVLWEKALDYVQREDLPLCIHVAESPAEYEYLMHNTGVLAEYQQQIVVNLNLPAVSPIKRLEDIGALDLKPLLVHTVQVDDDDIQRIKASRSIVAHCPRSNQRLRCGRMPLEKFLAADIPVYLGTDSLSSSPSLDVREEAEFAIDLHQGKVESETIESLLHQPL